MTNITAVLNCTEPRRRDYRRAQAILTNLQHRCSSHRWPRRTSRYKLHLLSLAHLTTGLTNYLLVVTNGSLTGRRVCEAILQLTIEPNSNFYPSTIIPHHHRSI